ncbi:MAG: hypothetical protein K0U93_12930, partial [Gammaproteobacteria bacterium]|nr:hypothetical protein [Gammaproteobacteria bacterium]
TTPSGFSDAAGASPRRLVYVSRYDGDNADGDSDPFTGTDPELIWVQVSIEGAGQSIQTLVGRH